MSRAIAVGVAVAVGVTVEVLVAVGVRVDVAVFVEVPRAFAVAVPATFAVAVHCAFAVLVAAAFGVLEGVGVLVAVGESGTAADTLDVGVRIGTTPPEVRVAGGVPYEARGVVVPVISELSTSSIELFENRSVARRSSRNLTACENSGAEPSTETV